MTYRIVEQATGREVVTTDQAAARRGITPGGMRKHIQRLVQRGTVTALPPLDHRTPVYYPDELGLEQP